MMEKYIKYWDNGSIKCEGQKLNRKPFGKWVYYHENGNIECEGQFDGYTNEYDLSKVPKRIGKWIYYHENGRKKEEGNYKSKLESHEEYLPQQEGTWTFWDEEGIKIKEKNRNNNVVTYYYKNGLIESIGEKGYNSKRLGGGRYSGEQKTGKWKYYYENGELKEECGHIIFSRTGMRYEEYHGLRTSYYKSGVKRWAANYYYNVKIGEEIEWDENGEEIDRITHISRLKAIGKRFGG